MSLRPSNRKITIAAVVAATACGACLACTICGSVAFMSWQRSHTLTPNQSVSIDGVKVQLLAGKRGQPLGRDRVEPNAKLRPIPPEVAMLKFRISNETTTEVINYNSWSEEIPGTLAIRDEFGNRYSHDRMPLFLELAGALNGGAKIHPKQAVNDMLRFDLPLDSAKELTLRLDGGNLGRPGHSIYCKVPTSFLK